MTLSDFNPRRRLLPLSCGILALACGAGLMAGCSKADSGGTSSNRSGEANEIAEVRKAFESAHVSMRYSLDEALRVVATSRPADALASLQTLGANPALNDTQKQAVNALIQKLKSDPKSLVPH